MTPKWSHFKKKINQISKASHPNRPIQPNKPIQPSKPILWDTPDLTDPIPPRRQTLIPGPAECAKRLNPARPGRSPCWGLPENGWKIPDPDPSSALWRPSRIPSALCDYAARAWFRLKKSNLFFDKIFLLFFDDFCLQNEGQNAGKFDKKWVSESFTFFEWFFMDFQLQKHVPKLWKWVFRVGETLIFIKSPFSILIFILTKKGLKNSSKFIQNIWKIIFKIWYKIWLNFL